MSCFELMVAPTGARLSQADHPALPITQDEIVKTAVACEAAGATALHLHVRDRAGRHSLDTAAYTALVTEVQAKTSLALQISSESAGLFDVPAQAACILSAPTPEVSASVRELARNPAQARELYAQAQAKGIEIQHILYDAQDAVDLLRAYDEGLIPLGRRRVIFVLGRYSEGQTSVPADLDPFLTATQGAGLDWSLCAFGQNEQSCLLAGLEAGGQVRIGFENNTRAPDGTPLADNAASVATFVNAAAARGFHPRKASS